MKKLVFSATLREINYLLKNDYLNEKGKKWAKGFGLSEEDKEFIRKCEEEGI